MGAAIPMTSPPVVCFPGLHRSEARWAMRAYVVLSRKASTESPMRSAYFGVAQRWLSLGAPFVLAAGIMWSYTDSAAQTVVAAVLTVVAATFAALVASRARLAVKLHPKAG